MTMITEEDLARMHQQEWGWSRRQRWVLGDVPLDPRRRLANQMEDVIREVLEERGYVVAGTRHQEGFDLLVQGVRVEVKASRGNGRRYTFNLHGNDADVLILGCVNHQVHFFVIPFADVAGLHMLKISQGDPCDYVGKWMRFYGAWDVVDELVAAGRNAWQPRLWEA